MRVVVVACDEAGNVDVADLRAKVDQHAERLAAIMLLPVDARRVRARHPGDLRAVHDAGGQVYVDGANLNAMVGLAKPGRFGSDVSHLNLHKTFCIPHGGGGGRGPIGVASTWCRSCRAPAGRHGDVRSGRVRRAVGVGRHPADLVGLRRLMGPDGLLAATEHAILAANYLATQLRDHFPVLYAGAGGLVAHSASWTSGR